MVAESAGAWAVSLGLVAWLRWCSWPVPLGLVAWLRWYSWPSESPAWEQEADEVSSHLR